MWYKRNTRFDVTSKTENWNSEHFGNVSERYTYYEVTLKEKEERKKNTQRFLSSAQEIGKVFHLNSCYNLRKCVCKPVSDRQTIDEQFEYILKKTAVCSSLFSFISKTICRCLDSNGNTAFFPHNFQWICVFFFFIRVFFSNIRHELNVKILIIIWNNKAR